MSLTRYNVAQAFGDIVATHGERTALALDERRGVTYRELDRLSNQLAHFLLSRGAGRGSRIAIQLEKGPTAYALVLASLKAGTIYVALDPRNPPARRDAI